ncbi:hypothetical protein FACS1894187_14960 [Synergistales bacterium]|nr:hypothetical protein FACS1894187_14960 [Synergistales bacterium]
MLSLVALVVIILLITLGGMIAIDSQFAIMQKRSHALQGVGQELTNTLLLQHTMYALRVNKFYQAKTESEKSELKAEAMSKWFTKAEIDAKNEYAYEEVRGKFGVSFFEAMDRQLNSTVALNIKNFTIKIPRDDLVYDLNGFLIVCRIIATIVLDDGFMLAPQLLSGTKYIKEITAERRSITETWGKHSLTITIPMKIEGDGKNFWID